jgi:hypothetical protein
MNNSAINRQVVMLEARGKKTQLFNTMIKCLGLSGREKTCACYRQTVSAGSGIGRGAAAPSALFPPSTEPGPASDGDPGEKDLHLREDASIAPADVSAKL